MHRQEKQERKPNPYVNASLISKLTYWYLKDLFKIGLSRTITVDDIYETIESHRSATVTRNFEKYWEYEKLNHASPSLIRCISKMHYKSVLLLGVLIALLDSAIKIVSPLCLGRLISYFTPNQTDISKNEAYLYALGIILCSIYPLFVFHPYSLYLNQVALKLKMAVSALIYRKCLKLTKSMGYDGMNGHVINLMTNDVGRFDIINYVHDLWKGPFQLCLLGYFVYREIGQSALVGLGFILSFIPLQAWLGKMLAKFTTNLSQRTDNRVRFMNEIIQGIQVIKMYAWENSFSKIVDKIRRKEIGALRKRYNLFTIHYSITIVGRFALFLSLFCYVIFGNTLDARKVFVTSIIFHMLDLQMVLFWPEAIKYFAEFYVAMKRIKTFLLRHEDSKSLEEGEEEKLIKAEREENPIATNKGITIKNASAIWNEEAGDRGIFLVDLKTTSNNLTAIIGKVGSGKSTLINAILGELELKEGTIEINGTISYAAQEPWLFEGTIRQNIIFVEEFDEERYREVCHVCALERDFELIPNGDDCIVGERGVILSGGQKARVSLARTIYKKADIYILDDPFSAVDVNVGRQIYNECILRFLKPKCVLLVTHQLQFIQNIEHIIYMNAGRIELEGDYKKIAQLKLDEILNLQLHTEHHSTNILDQTDYNCHEFEINANHTNQEAEDEKLQEGNVALKVFKIYFKSMNSTKFLIASVTTVLGGKLLLRALDYCLSEWVNWEQLSIPNQHHNKTVLVDPIPDNRRNFFLNTYAVLIGLLIILTVIGYASYFNLALKASRNLHDKLFKGIIRAAMTFFNNNSSGRVLNRFSRDINVVDNDLPLSLIDTSIFIMEVVSIVALIAIINYWLVFPAILMCLCFLLVRHIYINTSRCITRLRALTHSPVLAHANATLQGLSTIRSQKAENVIAKEFDKIQDLSTSTTFMCNAAATAFAFWLNIICIFYMGSVTLSFLVFDEIEAFLGGSVGAAISVSFGLLSLCQWGMSCAAELELSLIGVERVNEYIELPSEPPLETNIKPSSSWPSEGKIEFDHLYFRYTPDSDFVLKDLHFIVHPQEKIGVVGRTGAGKSSIVQALFRLADFDGIIKIDDVDIKTLGLHDLRTKLAIIPQNPVLFSGTLRMNLDPFEEKSDFEIYEALEKVEMKKFVTNMAQKLEFTVSDDGSNFSTGQKQLICLARAILRNNKILILDEATANIDLETDNLIQQTIRENFSNYTVITIAHRLNTVIDSDRVLVMDGGKVVEFDHPHILLEDPEGYFRKMVNQTGHISSSTLIENAKTNFSIRKKTD